MSSLSSKIQKNQSTLNDIESHLYRCNKLFKPELIEYVDIKSYSKKLFNKSTRYEVWNTNNLIALLAVYFNQESQTTYISNFSVENEFQGKFLAKRLFEVLMEESKNRGSTKILLEVFSQNTKAIRFYDKMGFEVNQLINENKIELKKEIHE